MSDTVDVDANCSGDVSINGSISVDGSVYTETNVYSRFALMPIKRPYVINPNHIEYIEGDWNPEKTEYGIRIGYTSGATRCFWGETARKVLGEIVNTINWYGQEIQGTKEKIVKKFEDRVKAGPPNV